jgi:hypothetical protein
MAVISPDTSSIEDKAHLILPRTIAKSRRHLKDISAVQTVCEDTISMGSACAHSEESSNRPRYRYYLRSRLTLVSGSGSNV